ncbi:MAG: DUF4446 family protein [Solirubrobacterales bacterium]
MAGLSPNTTSLVAVVAAAVAVVALVVAAAALWRLRQVRRDQAAVLGDSERDLAGHAAELERDFRALNDYMADVASRLDGRVGATEAGLAGSVTHWAIHRYDAYHEMSGHQSVSSALLDDHVSGVVISSIHQRDSSRLYVREVIDGDAPVELSPEERETVRLAMASGPGDRAGSGP